MSETDKHVGEQAEHLAHVKEEEVLHQQHEKEEEVLHSLHVQEEEALHREHEIEEQEHQEREVSIDVTYNGLTKTLLVNLEALTSVVLEAALNLFNITQNRHTMALYNSSGVELADGKSLKAQGVKKCDLLVLRQSTVKGGGR